VVVQQRDLGYPPTDTHPLGDEDGMRGGGGRKGMRDEADQAAKAAAEAASRKRPRLKEPGTWRYRVVVVVVVGVSVGVDMVVWV